MLELLETIAQDVIHEDEFRMTCVRHAVITDEDHVDYVCKVTRFKGVVYIPSESVDFEEYALDLRVRQRLDSWVASLRSLDRTLALPNGQPDREKARKLAKKIRDAYVWTEDIQRTHDQLWPFL